MDNQSNLPMMMVVWDMYQ